MKILVAGGAGYIGSALVPRLLERGYEVDVIDLCWFGNQLPPAARLMRRDLMSLETGELAAYRAVIFLAGLSNDPMAEYSPRRNFIENAAAPACLAWKAKAAGVPRFIHGGSCSVYGYTANELYDESSPTVCEWPYGLSKLQGEHGSLLLADDRFSVIAFRMGTVSGHSPRMRFDLLVNTMFRCAVQENRITVNHPLIWRPILAIGDAVEAFVRATAAPQDISGLFNIASGNFTVGQVASQVQETVQSCLRIRPEIRTCHRQDYRNYRVSVDRAVRLLGFEPRGTVDGLVRELAEHLDRYGDFSDECYYNIRRFQTLYPEPGEGK